MRTLVRHCAQRMSRRQDAKMQTMYVTMAAVLFVVGLEVLGAVRSSSGQVIGTCPRPSSHTRTANAVGCEHMSEHTARSGGGRHGELETL